MNMATTDIALSGEDRGGRRGIACGDERDETMPKMKNMLTLRSLLALALTCACSSPVSADMKTHEDRERKIDRHVKITPKGDGRGVAKGLVIAHGHVIRPPYSFNYKGSTLFVNGVQLIPSPVAERESERVRGKITADKRKFFAELGRIRAQARRMFEERRSHEEILQYVKAQTAIIADAKWKNEMTLVFRLVGSEEFTQGMWFRELTQTTKKQAKELNDPRVLQARLVEQYERDLATGVCLVFTSDNGVMRMTDPRNQVIEVMGDSSLSAAEREDALAKIFPMNRIAVYDVLANFSKAAWMPKEQ